MVALHDELVHSNDGLLRNYDSNVLVYAWLDLAGNTRLYLFNEYMSRIII